MLIIIRRREGDKANHPYLYLEPKEFVLMVPRVGLGSMQHMHCLYIYKYIYIDTNWCHHVDHMRARINGLIAGFSLRVHICLLSPFFQYEKEIAVLNFIMMRFINRC